MRCTGNGLPLPLIRSRPQFAFLGWGPLARLAQHHPTCRQPACNGCNVARIVDACTQEQARRKAKGRS